MKNMQGKKLHKNIEFRANNKGFTLTELIVTLVVMTIVASISASIIIAWQARVKFRRQNENAKTIYTAAANQLTSLNAGNSLEIFTNNFLDGDGHYTVNCKPIDPVTLSNPQGGHYTLDGVWKGQAQYTIVSIRTHKGDYGKYIKGELTDKQASLVFQLLSDSITDGGLLNGAIAIELSPEAGQVFAVCYSDSIDYLLYASELSGSQNINDDPTINKRKEEDREKFMIGYFGVDEMSVEQKDPYPILSAKICAEVCNEDVFGLKIYTNNPDIKGSLGNLSYEFTLKQGTTKYKVEMTNSNSNKVTDKWKAVTLVMTPYVNGNLANNKKVNITVPARVVNSDGFENIYFAFDAVDIQAQTTYYNITDEEDTNINLFDSTYSFCRFIRKEMLNQDNITFEVEKIVGKNTSNQNIDIPKGDVTYPKSNEGNTVASSPLFASRLVAGNDVNYGISNFRHLYNIRYVEEGVAVKVNKDTGEVIKSNKVEQKTGNKRFSISENLDWQAFVDNRSVFSSSSHVAISGVETGTVNIAPGTEVKYPSYYYFSNKSELTSVEPKSKKMISNLSIDYDANGVYEVNIINAEYSAGLFIENEGEISYIDLNKIKVIGSKTTGTLAACNKGSINNVKISGESIVTGGNATGGVVGDNETTGELNDIEIDSEVVVTGKNFVGGLTGVNRSNKYGDYEINPKSIKGNYFIGGLIGGNFTTLSENQTIMLKEGKVPQLIEGYSFVGGVIGYNSLSSAVNDINRQIRQLNELVDGHQYPGNTYDASKDFNKDDFVKTSAASSNGKKLIIATTETEDENSVKKYDVIQFPEYNEDDERGVSAISHAAGICGFNSKYSEIEVLCPVEMGLKGKETEYTYQNYIPGTGTTKYYIVLSSGNFWSDGPVSWANEFELTYSGGKYKFEKSWSFIIGRYAMSGELKCKDYGLGTDATPDGNSKYFSKADLDYLYDTGKKITVDVTTKYITGWITWWSSNKTLTYTIDRRTTGNQGHYETTTAHVNKGEYYAGVVAENYGTLTVKGDVKADLKGERAIGGLVSENNKGAVLNVEANVEVDLESERNNNYTDSAYINNLNAGGYAANNFGVINNSFADENTGDIEFVEVNIENIKAYTYAGGIIGYQDSTDALSLSKIQIKGKVPENSQQGSGGEGQNKPLIESENQHAGGMIARAVTDVIIEDSLNGVDVKAKETAAGIIGELHGNADSTIKNCHNKGEIEANYAAGILAKVSTYQSHSVNNIYLTSCTNSGYIDGEYSAGIASDTAEKGTFNTCRNYVTTKDEGNDLDSGITLGTAKKIVYCLDGADNSTHISNDTSKEYLNFYFGDEELYYGDKYRVQTQQIYGYYLDEFNDDHSCYFNPNVYKGVDDDGYEPSGSQTHKPRHMTDLSGNINSIADYVLDKDAEAYQNPTTETYPNGIGIWKLHSDNYNNRKTYTVISNEILDKNGKFNPTKVQDVSIVWNNATIDYPTVIAENKTDMYNQVTSSGISANGPLWGNIWGGFIARRYTYSNGIWVVEPDVTSQNGIILMDWMPYIYNNQEEFEGDSDAQIVIQAIDICFNGDINDFNEYFQVYYYYNYIDYYNAHGFDSTYNAYMADVWPKFIAHLYDLLHPYVTYDYQVQVKSVAADGNEKNKYYLRSCTVVDADYAIDTLDLSTTSNAVGDIDINTVVIINIELRNATTNVKAFKDKVSIRALYWTPEVENTSVPMNKEIVVNMGDVEFEDALEAAKTEHETILTSYKDDNDDRFFIGFKGAYTGIDGLSQDPSPASNSGWTKDIGYSMMEEQDKKYLTFIRNIKDSGAGLEIQPDLTPIPNWNEH